MALQHPLSYSWSLMFLPAITKELIQEHNGYDAAQKATLKVIGELKTIEEAASTFNSLPKLSSLAKNDSIVLSREGKAPKFEAFAADARKLVVDTSTDETTRAVLDTLLIALLGENIGKIVGENPCHILRMAHKPSQKTPNMVRFEVWMEPCLNGKGADVKTYFSEILNGCTFEESALQQ
eukprot:GDKK01017835.1.p1 GENE.GDKK01017835.1~~GDKK01017835.1.p1  ORF type:complete len:180 (-),score=19.70 GDKK01017835.1:155-694(-)